MLRGTTAGAKRTWTLRALRPMARPTSSRMAVVGKRDCRDGRRATERDQDADARAEQRRERTCASKACSTAAWCGVVKVRVRFFLGGGGGSVGSPAWLEPASASLSAMSPWDEAVEGVDWRLLPFSRPCLSPSPPLSIEVLRNPEKVPDDADSGSEEGGPQVSGVVGDWKTRAASREIGGCSSSVNCGSQSASGVVNRRGGSGLAGELGKGIEVGEYDMESIILPPVRTDDTERPETAQNMNDRAPKGLQARKVVHEGA